MLKTRIDLLAEMAEAPTHIDVAARKLEIKEEVLEYIVRVLEKIGVFSVEYPAIGSPIIRLVKPIPSVEEKIPKKFDEKVQLTVSGVPAEVFIYRDEERRPFYHIIIPKLGPYTTIFLESIKSDIAKGIPFEAHYFLTPEKMQEYLPSVRAKIKQRIEGYFEEENLEVIAGLLFVSMYGMGDIEFLLEDPALEEVAINTSNLPVSVYHTIHGWMKTNITMRDEDSIANVAAQIARRVGKQVTIANPILDAFLTTGDRAAATLYPVSTKGNTITIRKFAKEPWTTIKFIKNRTLSHEMAAFLWQAIHYEINVVITGGTASGKTSCMNTLTHLIPNFQRVITIEEVRELTLPEHIWNWIPLLTRGGIEEEGGVSMEKLLTTSLRLRPDRMILGEIRTREEATVLFDAMHTGHSVMSTMHADTAAQLLRRLLEAPFDIHPTEIEAIQLVVVQHRDRRRNIRRTYEISEIVPGIEGKLSTNRVYMWRPRTDKFEKVNPPRRYIEEINLYTGMTEREILEDLKERVKILKWMAKRNYVDLSAVGEVMRTYYNAHKELMKAVRSGRPLKTLKK